MKLSDKGLIELMAHEGIVVAPYKDSRGVWTFGVGHTASAGNPDPSKMQKGPVHSDGVQEALMQALQLFAADVRKYERDVLTAFARPITQAQFDAAVSFHYNTGAIKRATWVKLFNDGNMRDAKKAFMNWRKPPEILDRRRAERDLFFDGVYKARFIPMYNADANGKTKRMGTYPTQDALRLTKAATMPVYGNSRPIPEPVGKDRPVRRPDPSTGDPKRGGLVAIIAGGAVALYVWVTSGDWEWVTNLFGGGQ